MSAFSEAAMEKFPVPFYLPSSIKLSTIALSLRTCFLAILTIVPLNRDLQAQGDEFDALKSHLITLSKTPSELNAKQLANLNKTMQALPCHVERRAEWAKVKFKKAFVYAYLLNLAFAATDWKFDMSKFPQMYADPPEQAGIPTGTTPDAIADPVLRAEYIKNIEVVRAYALVYDEQFDLRHEYTDLEVLFSLYVHTFFTPSEARRLANDLTNDEFIKSNKEQVSKWFDYPKSQGNK